MKNDNEKLEKSNSAIKVIEDERKDLISKFDFGGKYPRFVLAILSSLPWVGGVFSALNSVAGLKNDINQEKTYQLQKLWLQEYTYKIKDLEQTIQEILFRFNSFGDEIKKRLEDPEYINIVKKSFIIWDQADTKEKRQMIKKLIINAGAITLCSDDLVRLFISWINQYNEAHFLVIKEIYQNPEITRGEIWDKLNTNRPQEDSAEADLFRYLIRDLSTGGVIRQERETDYSGNFLKKTRGKNTHNNIMESAFEDTKPYVLTKLGMQFVHYAMDDLAPQIEATT